MSLIKSSMEDLDKRAPQTSAEPEDDVFCCVWCDEPTDSLYIQYTPDLVRLQTCIKCGNYVDEYVEFDNLSIFLDLLLQKRAAYRHVLSNSGHKVLWRFLLVVIMADAYVNWITWRAERFEVSSALSVDLLEWEFQRRLLISAVVYSLFLFLATIIGIHRQKIGENRPVTVKVFSNGMIISLFPVLLRLPAVIWSTSSTFSMIWPCYFLQLISVRQVYAILSKTSATESLLTIGTLLGLALSVQKSLEL